MTTSAHSISFGVLLLLLLLPPPPPPPSTAFSIFSTFWRLCLLCGSTRGHTFVSICMPCLPLAATAFSSLEFMSSISPAAPMFFRGAL